MRILTNSSENKMVCSIALFHGLTDANSYVKSAQNFVFFQGYRIFAICIFLREIVSRKLKETTKTRTYIHLTIKVITGVFIA